MTLARRTWLFVAFCLAVCVVGAGVLQRLVAFALADDSASHVVLIPFMTAALIARDRASVFASVRFAPLPGVAAVLCGLCAMGAAGWGAPALGTDVELRLAVAGIVGMWAGGFLLFYGSEAFRAARFPILMLVATIPIPLRLLDAFTHLLKVGSTETVAQLFSITGIPFHRQGFTFSLPAFVIEVADECSGIRSTVALVITALLAGDLYLRSTWKKALLVLAVVPVTIVKNAVRIVTLSLLATYVHPSFLVGRLHNEGGVVFFLIALGILAPLLAILRRSDAASGHASRAASISV